MQIVGLLMAITAFLLFLSLVITSARRKNNPSFLPLFASIAFVLLGVFLTAMPAIASSTLLLVATWSINANLIVYVDGIGLISANGGTGLYIEQNHIPYHSFAFSNFVALAATQKAIYIATQPDGFVYKYNIITKDTTIILDLYPFPFDIAVGPLNSVTDAVFANNNGNITFNGKQILPQLTAAHAITVHDRNLYISDQTRIVVYNYDRDTIVRIIGPLPMARRMALFTNNKQQTYLVMVPLNPGSSVQLFDLDGKLFTSIKGLTTEIAVSSGQLFLSDGQTRIRIFE